MGDTQLDDDQSKALRIVLVGKTGSGKSATANTILGDTKFESKLAACSVTSKCQKAFREWKGKKVLVVDTPGLFDTEKNLRTTCKEISKCILYSSPGPHAIILVIQLNRYTEEEQQVFAMVKDLFGEPVTNHMIVLFTRKDDLAGRGLSDFISESNEILKSLIRECGGRCCAFNNNAEGAEKEAQVEELMQLIEKMIPNKAHFTTKIYKDVEVKLNQTVEKLKKNSVIQFGKEPERVEQKYASKSQKEGGKVLEKQRASQIENLREKAEESIFDDIYQMLLSLLSILFPFWRKN